LVVFGGDYEHIVTGLGDAMTSTENSPFTDAFLSDQDDQVFIGQHAGQQPG
jgi:hypothetical protein